MMMGFEILSEIRDIEAIAAGRGVYIRRYLERTTARVAGGTSREPFPDGEIFMAIGRQYLREDGKRSRWMRGCILWEEDFGG